jgi:predicted GNAT family acetyltransferase
MPFSTETGAAMFATAMRDEIAGMISRPPATATRRTSNVQLLTNAERAEVLAFLGTRPVHTVTMSSFICDNGLVSSLNRGMFYGCRNSWNQLDGIALIGHTILFESRTDAAIEAFAHVAQNCLQTHLLMGEHEKVQRFWNYFAESRDRPRAIRPVLLLEQKKPFTGYETLPTLRPATLDELSTIVSIQAEMLLEETGTDPLLVDPVGFRERCARRIEQKRSWVWVEDGQLIFKVDIIAQTQKCTYIEGVYTNPLQRRRGYGMRGLSQMGHILLKETESICLFVEESDSKARSFYGGIGYDFSSRYDLLYFNKKSSRMEAAS